MKTVLNFVLHQFHNGLYTESCFVLVEGNEASFFLHQSIRIMETHSHRSDWHFLSSFRLVRRLRFPCEWFWVSTNRTVWSHKVSGSEGPWEDAFWRWCDVGSSVMLREDKQCSEFCSLLKRKLVSQLCLESWRPCRSTSSRFIPFLYCQGVLWQHKLLWRPVSHFGEGLGEAETAGGGEWGCNVCRRFGCVAG